MPNPSASDWTSVRWLENDRRDTPTLPTVDGPDCSRGGPDHHSRNPGESAGNSSSWRCTRARPMDPGRATMDPMDDPALERAIAAARPSARAREAVLVSVRRRLFSGTSEPETIDRFVIERKLGAG